LTAFYVFIFVARWSVLAQNVTEYRDWSALEKIEK
jgi:hypothetical protein